jgi:hypothetical protein
VKRDSITIVLVPETREPLTMEFSGREVLLILAILLGILCTAAFSIFKFKDLRAQYLSLNSSIRELKVELRDREVQLKDMKIKLEAQKGLILMIGAEQDTFAVEQVDNSRDIQVEDFTVQHLENNLTVNFRLVNTLGEDKVRTGYLLILVEHDSGDLSRYGAFPGVQLLPGQPIDYRAGDSFAIHSFKAVNATIPLKDKPEAYKAVKIMVFDGNGKILLHETHNLG